MTTGLWRNPSNPAGRSQDLYRKPGTRAGPSPLVNGRSTASRIRRGTCMPGRRRWRTICSLCQDRAGHASTINNMLIDLMASMSHKDWLSRRQRQKQGIERAHTLGRYRGKQADQEGHQKFLYYRQVKKLSIRETADATGYSASQICRIQALYRKIQTEVE